MNAYKENSQKVWGATPAGSSFGDGLKPNTRE